MELMKCIPSIIQALAYNTFACMHTANYSEQRRENARIYRMTGIDTLPPGLGELTSDCEIYDNPNFGLV